MYSKRLFSVFGVAAIISPARAGSCNADNCLRAIRATTRLPQASTDCAAILDVTVTPSIVTVTEYSTVLETNTATIPTTLVQTVHDTLTTVVRATSTVEASETVTVQPAKRAVSDGVPACAPAYASPCSGLVRFSSACSCIGVTAKTVTAAALSTTVTLPATNTISTSIIEPVETDYSTVDDATVTQTTTDATVTSTVLTTVTPTPATPQSVSGRLTFTANGQTLYMTNYDSGGILSYGYASSTPDTAMQLTLDASGQLWYGTKIAKGDTNYGTLQFFFVDPTASTTRTAFTCRIDASNALLCGFGAGTADVAWALRSNNFIYGGKLATLQAAGYPIITLTMF
ncbi:hypothetical protein CONLIGDRAFT_630168 [Coniochaeta ligniaria NRRL 30616]|uniref:Uncharacterized protein n=1 Tax=Coniochaeta ligniaria NRRL 30616 TaxID=1408157 RepID=A0A1J7JGJ7_9PEZI|nr:hypothetical protein CONLIGDRAFT_630168 [Coniochaeta ligniaria NRRL 30616]